MDNFSGSLMRNRRNLLDIKGFTPNHFTRSNYSTDAHIKSEMKHTFEDDLLCNFHLLSDPLKKNLADSVITGVEKKKNMLETKEYTTQEAVKPPNNQRTDYYPSLAGITNFFSGVLNVMGTIFHKRASSPASQYYDTFDSDYDDQQLAPSIIWQTSNFEVQNKNEQADMLFASNNDSHTNLDTDMSVDCRTAANHCEKKLNEVRLLLSNETKKNVQNTKTSKYSRRPKRAFVEASSVEESFEDAFSPESFLHLPNNTFIEYYSPFNYHDDLLVVSDAPRIKTDLNVFESIDVSKNLPDETENKPSETKQSLNTENCSKEEIVPTKTNDEVVSSCEDKLSKLKVLLQSKCRKSTNKDTNKEVDVTTPIPIPSPELPIETVFGSEINSSDIQNSNSSQNSDYFNEVTGKFNSSSVDSEDSFQIVFTDSPQNCRKRLSSDCESEDSFIVFEESPDSCYTSNEVFGDEIDLDNDSSDADSIYDEDSGCGSTCKLSPNLSRTFCDLTDNSLYSQDVVDSGQVSAPSVVTTEKTGLLLDETRKKLKKNLPAKKVHFSTLPPKVHVMRVWAFAARQARAGHWERHALDRERFKRRIADVEMAISWVLKPQHRARVVFQRFRPWWNAQKRKELAEKKEIEEREKSLKLQREEQREAENRELINKSDDTESKDSLDENTGTVENNIDQKDDHIVEISSDITTANVDQDNILNNNTIPDKCKNIELTVDRDVCKSSINDRDQNDLNTQANDNDSNEIIHSNEINDSNETKDNDVLFIKIGDMLIKDGCIDT
ncbi:uncharacterized protein LOC124542007 [Vanessa cardui]|uniref:uncharacterized protein LOC124542007 n=1 Tax=Vanessa cardui TaxID=171605 RepID=UPI001F141C5F|nr:uncharacterized protein LOC124542007 [Vanessa cardui]